jgi:hypothetical protein
MKLQFLSAPAGRKAKVARPLHQACPASDNNKAGIFVIKLIKNKLA